MSPPIPGPGCLAGVGSTQQETICVRRWTEDDRQVLLALCRQMHRESRYAFLSFDNAKMERFIDLHLGDPENRCGLASIERGALTGLLAGYITEYFFSSSRVARDQIVFVKSSRRGTAAAVRLIDGFREWARQRGAREVVLGITTAIHPARSGAFYERLGYEFVGGTYVQRVTEATAQSTESGL